MSRVAVKRKFRKIARNFKQNFCYFIGLFLFVEESITYANIEGNSHFPVPVVLCLTLCWNYRILIPLGIETNECTKMSDMRKDYHPTQPHESKYCVSIDRNAIRDELIESSEFASLVGDKFRDQLGETQAAMIAYYLQARTKAIASGDLERVRSYNASLASYVDEVFAPMLRELLDWMVEEYIDRNYVQIV